MLVYRSVTGLQNLSFNMLNQFFPLCPTTKIKSEELMPAECFCFFLVYRNPTSVNFLQTHTKQQTKQLMTVDGSEIRLTS